MMYREVPVPGRVDGMLRVMEDARRELATRPAVPAPLTGETVPDEVRALAPPPMRLATASINFPGFDADHVHDHLAGYMASLAAHWIASGRTPTGGYRAYGVTVPE